MRVPFIAVFIKDAYTRTISSHSSPASFSPCPFPYQGHPLTFPPDNGGRACAVQLTRIVYARAHTNVPTLGAGAGWRGHLKKVKRTPETATARPRQFYCALKNTHGGFRVRRNEEMVISSSRTLFICLLPNFLRATDRAIQMTIMVRFRPKTMQLAPIMIPRPRLSVSEKLYIAYTLLLWCLKIKIIKSQVGLKNCTILKGYCENFVQ